MGSSDIDEEKQLKKEKKRLKKDLKKTKRKRESLNDENKQEGTIDEHIDESNISKNESKIKSKIKSDNLIQMKVANSSFKNQKYDSPLVISFPNGIPSITNTKYPTLNWSIQKRKTLRGNMTGKIIHGEDETCFYNSNWIVDSNKKNHTSIKSNIQNTSNKNNRSQPLTKLMIGIYDKHSKSITLHVTAENGKIFALQQKMKTAQNSNIENNTHGDSHLFLTNVEENEKRRILFDSFGSAKKRKQLKGREANKVSLSTVVGTGENMLTAAKKQNMSKSNIEAMKEVTLKQNKKITAVEQAYEEARKSFLPPFDRYAKLPHLVYNPKAICDEASWNQISRSIDAALYKASEEPNQKSWIHLITSRGGTWSEPIMDLFKTIENPKFHKNRIKYIVLLHHHISFFLFFASLPFFRAKNWTIQRLAARIRLPFDVTPRLLQLFTVTDNNHNHHANKNKLDSNSNDTNAGMDETLTFTMDTTHKNKCLIHILLLYIIAHGKEMKVGSINALVKLLQLEINVANNLLRQAGCTVTKRVGGTVAVSLSVPLKFPPSRRAKK